MILIGLGANLPSSRHGPPVATLEAALVRLAGAGVRVAARSRWYRSAPLPRSDQPWYVNGVARVESALAPTPLLALLHEVEREFGRRRRRRWEARPIDLDLLAYGALISGGDGAPGAPALPHPRLHERAFVLVPLCEVAPDWRHPVLGQTAAELIPGLPPDQIVVPLGDGAAAAGSPRGGAVPRAGRA